MRIAVLGCLALVGCGRLRFDEHGSADARVFADSSTLSDDASGDDAAAAVCGNSVCEGTAGELCSSCAGDCNVTSVVCGNLECQVCGPSPWPFTAEDNSLLNDVNAARTGGVMCPGDSSPRFAAAVSLTTTLQQGTREQVWEIAHGMVFNGDGSSCNGRTFAQRTAVYGGNGNGVLEVSTSSAFATTADVVTAWKATSRRARR